MVSLSTAYMGATPAQSELVAHWHTCRREAELPNRERLDPGAIRAHLSAISMVEMGVSGRAKFRLVGSGLRQIFGREMRGRFLSELDKTAFEIWSLGLARAIHLQQPVGGLIARDADSHAWLRLPLWCDRLGALVLCHDALIPNARLGLGRNSESRNRAPSGNILAA